MSASDFEQWESVRDACELLVAIADAQHAKGLHSLAGAAAQWLEHIGGVAAYESAAAAAPGRHLSTFVGSEVIQ